MAPAVLIRTINRQVMSYHPHQEILLVFVVVRVLEQKAQTEFVVVQYLWVVLDDLLRILKPKSSLLLVDREEEAYAHEQNGEIDEVESISRCDWKNQQCVIESTGDDQCAQKKMDHSGCWV